MRAWNKNGNVLLDLILYLIYGFILAIFVVFLFFANSELYDKLLDAAPGLQASFGDGTNVTEVIHGSVGEVQSAFEILKWASVMLLIGMVLSIWIGNYFVSVHPVFFIPYIFVVIIAVIIAAPISNAYETLYLNATLNEAFSGFTGLNFIFANLPSWIMVIGFVGGIILVSNIVKGGREGRF